MITNDNVTTLLFNKRNKTLTTPYHLIWNILIITVKTGISKFAAYSTLFNTMVYDTFDLANTIDKDINPILFSDSLSLPAISSHKILLF